MEHSLCITQHANYQHSYYYTHHYYYVNHAPASQHCIMMWYLHGRVVIHHCDDKLALAEERKHRRSSEGIVL